MKSLKKIFGIMFCTLIIACSLFTNACASNITYDDVSEKLIFDTTSKSNPKDLFENFKNLMPGDKITQEVVIKNKGTNRVDIELYLRSLGAEDEASKKLLSELKLTVKQNGNSTLFEAPASETSTLTDWVFLGTIRKGAEIKLNLTLEVPITVGNEFQDAAGTVKWQFKSEELAIDTAKMICPVCGHECDIINGEHTVYHCNHCGYEEDMHCHICGDLMHKVIRKGKDGKYYIYYECFSSDKHDKHDEHIDVDEHAKCPKCGSEMEIRTVAGTDGEYLVYHCNHCGYEEPIRCPICGGLMRIVVSKNPDGSYYEYYECYNFMNHPHPTEPKPSPVTGDNTNPTVWIIISVVALICILLCIFLGAKRKKDKKEQ